MPTQVENLSFYGRILVGPGAQGAETESLPKRLSDAAAEPSPDFLKLDQAFELGGQTRSDASALQVVLAENQLVSVQIGDSVIWLTAPDFLDWNGLRTDVKSETRGLQSDARVVHIAPSAAPGTRGDGLFGQIVRFFTPRASEKIEIAVIKALEQENQLLTLVANQTPYLSADKKPNTSTKPWLLFLHGTASNSLGSFAPLWQPEVSAQRAAFAHDDARFSGVLAFQHRTLSQSPIANVHDLILQLPEAAELIVVSFSRGGLVGALLAQVCRGLSEADIERFNTASVQEWRDKDQYAAEVKTLSALSALAKKKRLRVLSHIPVGAPLRGTSIADGRLSRFVSALAYVGQIGTRVFAPAITPLVELLSYIAKDLADFSDVPGLRAMHPKGAFVGWLNSLDIPSNDVFALYADADDTGMRKVLDFAMDRFFPGDNDWVVDTASMVPGYSPLRAAYASDVSGAKVFHLSYFSDVTVQRRLLSAVAASLSGKAEALSSEGFRKLEATKPPSVRAARPIDADIVYVLPGIMGSELAIEQNIVWVDKLELFFGGMEKLVLRPNDRVRATRPLPDSYGKVLAFLAESFEVVPFAFDWRKPIEDSARLLAESIKATLATAGARPIRFLAHSMGGLVARTLMLKEPDLWKTLVEKHDTRLLMLGTPNLGSYAIGQVLSGQEGLLKLLALGPSSMEEVVGICSKFGGVLDMLPEFDSEIVGAHSLRPFEQSFWAKLFSDAKVTLPLADANDLARAAQFRAELRAQILPEGRVFYVAGVKDATPYAAEVVSGWFGHKKIAFKMTAKGDGRVTWAHGIPSGIKTWYVDAIHGDLADVSDAFAGYSEVLRSGKTLSKSLLDAPPSRAKRALLDAATPLSSETARGIWPNAVGIAQMAAGGGGQALARLNPAQPMVQLEVKCCDVRSASFQTMVGHYRYDELYSAEAALNYDLGGALEHALQLGTYPLEIGQARVFPAQCQSQGALVVGLGEFGSMTTGMLVDTISQAVTRWLEEMLLHPIANANRGELESEGASLSAVLIGTGGGGVGVEPALQALLEGVRSATERHVQVAQKLDRRYTRLKSLQIVELYSDRAHLAWHTLQRICANGSYREFFQLRQGLQLDHTARERSYMLEDTTWAQRIKIDRRSQYLHFTVFAGLARVEGRTLYFNSELSDSLIRNASENGVEAAEISTALFQQLVPREIKEATPNSERILLIVDPKAAGIPWELMRPGEVHEKRKPLSVLGGIVRQLSLQNPPRVLSRIASKRVLVLGDPELGDRFKQYFNQLEGAAHESAAVHTLLKQSGRFVVSGGDGWQSNKISAALFSQSYQIMHLAGHGVFQWQVPGDSGDAKTGMVLSNGFFTPDDVEKLPGMPELVFINCCHLGRMDEEADASKVKNSARINNFPELAANLAEKFISFGARAVVAAGWAVGDAAAKLFAETFYECMLKGDAFIDAVRQAREAAYERYPDDNTWGAYQCYGLPDYRLDNRNDVRPPTRYASPQDLEKTLLRAAMQKVKRCNDAECAKLISQVEDELALLPDSLTTPINVQEALSDFYWEAGAFAKCAATTLKALKSSGYGGTLQLLVRAIAASGRALATADANSAQALVASVAHLLIAIEEMPATKPRTNNRASFYRRVAQASHRLKVNLLGSVVSSLNTAAKLYNDTIALIDTDADNSQYENQLAFVLLAKEWSAKLTPAQSKQLQTIAQTAPSDTPSTEFWLHNARAERKLLGMIYADNWPSETELRESVLAPLLAALQPDPDRDRWTLLLETLEFLQSFAPEEVRLKMEAVRLGYLGMLEVRWK